MKILNLTILSCFFFFLAAELFAQQAYFIDGYHGGIYGHYPEGQTRFIVENLKVHPDWIINIEIEPETWELVKERDPEAYEEFKKIFSDQSTAGSRIEYINPTYSQPYLFNASGESMIRQFSYGINLVRRHFPEAVFTSYSAEEPCFTSALPAVLDSFGFSYASTKNPNTMWGGYTRAYGGELVNWVGPDGTRITTAPRYACEDLLPGSTWQSIAWANSREYIQKCIRTGIQHPVGMCIQDAAWKSGWSKGPFLGTDGRNRYVTWRNYIENCSIGTADDEWRFSQEDVLVSLVWGSQILQGLAQDVRAAENKIVQTEKAAVLGKTYGGMDWPVEAVDKAWTQVLLAQHHDCWIVPYNRLQGRRNWAEQAAIWTGTTNVESANVIDNVTKTLALAGNSGVTVFNTLGFPRSELVETIVPDEWEESDVSLLDSQEKKRAGRILERFGKKYLAFIADVPSCGFANYKILHEKAVSNESPRIAELENGRVKLESDHYEITFNLEKGGIIESVIAKILDDREFVDLDSERSFNELRGYFFKDEKFLSSVDSPARFEIPEQNPISLKLALHGKIGIHPFTQTIRLTQGEKRIDMRVKIDWVGNPGIGEGNQEFRQEDRRKPFYDSSYKLQVYFPAKLKSGLISKNAPFDVCESRLDDTFFDSWDKIKHNIILNWVDIYDKEENYGLGLFSDHTTSYSYGNGRPLGLTLQYSGKGLWGRDYGITLPSEVAYSIIPHQGGWAESRIWSEGERINEPLFAVLSSDDSLKSNSLLEIEDNAYELSAMYFQGDELYVRMFNAQSDDAVKAVKFNISLTSAELVELGGRTREKLELIQGEGTASVKLSIPRFGFRTIRINGTWPNFKHETISS